VGEADPHSWVFLNLYKVPLVPLHNIVTGDVRRIIADMARWCVLVGVASADGAPISRVTPHAIIRLALSPGKPCWH
jgi:hypothetical protein